MMIAGLAALCMCRSTVGRRAGSTLGQSSCDGSARSSCVKTASFRWTNPRLRLSGNFGWDPMYLTTSTTRSASFLLGLLGIGQRARLRCCAMLPWMRLASS